MDIKPIAMDVLVIADSCLTEDEPSFNVCN